MKKEKLTIDVEVAGLDEQLEKVEKFVEKLKEAKTLADELASVEFEIAERNKKFPISINGVRYAKHPEAKA